MFDMFGLVNTLAKRPLIQGLQKCKGVRLIWGEEVGPVCIEMVPERIDVNAIEANLIEHTPNGWIVKNRKGFKVAEYEFIN